MLLLFVQKRWGMEVEQESDSLAEKKKLKETQDMAIQEVVQQKYKRVLSKMR
jgi:hypothetical protein